MKWKTKIFNPREFERDWHIWFAWYPVKVQSGETVWLEIIEKKTIYVGSFMRWNQYINHYRIRKEE